MTEHSLALSTLIRIMSDRGVRRLYAKVLAPNDNSKNQPYFGGDFGVLNILPSSDPVPDRTPGSKRQIFRARINFAWLSDDGSTHRAPGAQLILYPQYPEVRFSGYLAGCDRQHRPSALMGSTREPDRLLFLGVTESGLILGYAAGPRSRIATEFARGAGMEQLGVFLRVPMGPADRLSDGRGELINELCRIARLGWIDSKRLRSDGVVAPCNSPNCGGYTLEAELGVVPNGFAAPDFRGWEVKQHAVSSFARVASNLITLLTPQPTGGLYEREGVIAFVERYGYDDLRGRVGRRNFGGSFRIGIEVPRTGLTLQLLGYDHARRGISDATGGIALLDRNGKEAAIWHFSALMSHWKKKHALAAYVPAMRRTEPNRQYRFGSEIRLGLGTTFENFLGAVADGLVVYDPGIKVAGYPDAPIPKHRSQFRIRSKDIGSLYGILERVDVCSQASPPPAPDAGERHASDDARQIPLLTLGQK
jgi:hypothetical protein